MILHRCFAWDRRAAVAEPGGALWFPRPFQGDGRHDNTERYGCLYLAEAALSPVIEQLARFRGTALAPGMLRRQGLPLALATIELADGAELVDLDRPEVLAARGLRPSMIATRRREVTQPQALAIYDRGAARLRVGDVRALDGRQPVVAEALATLGLAVG